MLSKGLDRRGVSPAATRSPPVEEDDAVSEVIGFMLTFGIISMILIISMIAFAKAQADAEVRVVNLHGEAVANRVAGIVVEAALFAEAYDPSGSGAAEFSYFLDLPTHFEGETYTVAIDAGEDEIVVTLGDGSTARAQLFQAGGGSSGTPLCQPSDAANGVIPAGPLAVRYDRPVFALASPASPAPCIFLEASA